MSTLSTPVAPFQETTPNKHPNFERCCKALGNIGSSALAHSHVKVVLYR